MAKPKKKEHENSLKSVLIRYFILVLVAVPNLALFYWIFTPLTVYPVYLSLEFFYDVVLISKNVILINQSVPIELIKACIAGSAYYLLLILNLSIPKIKPKQRVNAIVFSFLVFLVLNILRIFFLSLLAISGSSYFDVTHIIFWYTLSTVIVVGIWFFEVKLFKIKEFPLYSDIKFLLRQISGK